MKKENGKARVLNKTEFNRVVKFQMSTRHGLRNVLLLHLSFFIGLRAKKMGALTVGDLIDVNGDLKEEVTLKRHQTKRNKQRRFYLTNDKLKKVLIQYLTFRKEREGELSHHLLRIKCQVGFLLLLYNNFLRKCIQVLVLTDQVIRDVEVFVRI